ncbi:uncharacterized protein LOC128884585, partial [Hylaeus volcanicus]|uniref:uncharacterized protein LOC128884585 n=1 Tax=Hylaeus volcanicus TaxID=313075 RepID=UPI0023B87E61
MEATKDVKIRDPLVLNERLLSLSGTWPVMNRYIPFAFMLVYVALFLVMQYWDFYESLDDVNLAVQNLLESLVTTSSYLVLILIKLNAKKLKDVVVKMKREITDKNTFKDNVEKRLYYEYNIICNRFVKYATIATFITMVLMYTHPMIHWVLTTVKGNSTLQYELPFRAHIFFDYKQPRIYPLVYIYQLPLTYIPMVHVAEVSFVVNLILHLCSKLAILSYRIRNVQVQPVQSFKNGIKESVIAHLEL